MHELSVAQALLDEIEAVARPRGARRVAEARVRIGPLAGVDAELLRRAFNVGRRTRLATADTVLSVEIAGVRVACADCSHESAATAGDLRCRACGSNQTRLRSGDEMLLVSVALDVPEFAAATDA